MTKSSFYSTKLYLQWLYSKGRKDETCCAILFTGFTAVWFVVASVWNLRFLDEHRRQHDFFFHCDNLLVQLDDNVHVLLNLEVHVGRVVLFRIILEHNHSILLINGGENFTWFDLKREGQAQHVIRTSTCRSLTICKIYFSASAGPERQARLATSESDSVRKVFVSRWIFFLYNVASTCFKKRWKLHA